MVRSLTRNLLITCAATAIVFAAAMWPSRACRIETEDVNHDGRPDVWDVYDASGTLTHASIDTNFDGQPDREEEYEHGALSHRESDRNFDGQVDLAEDFDPDTGEPVRSVVDVDFDGQADLLILLQQGLPVHSEWAPRRVATDRQPIVRAERQSRRTGLIAFDNPFDRAPRLRGNHHRERSALGTITPGAPTRSIGRYAPSPFSSGPLSISFLIPGGRARSSRSPRAPPSQLFA